MSIASQKLSANETDTRELNPSESQDLFARRCNEELGVTAAEFLDAVKSDSYPDHWPVPAISRVEMLLPFAR